MPARIRHCVECPKCCTRYLVASSPYCNGSSLVPIHEGSFELYTLYCSCARPRAPSQWNSGQLKKYVVSSRAHDRGYGTPEEIVQVRDQQKAELAITRWPDVNSISKERESK